MSVGACGIKSGSIGKMGKTYTPVAGGSMGCPETLLGYVIFPKQFGRTWASITSAVKSWAITPFGLKMRWLTFAPQPRWQTTWAKLAATSPKITLWKQFLVPGFMRSIRYPNLCFTNLNCKFCCVIHYSVW